jgi:diguanylate cyclase (GGDEF)-like protein
MLSWGWRVRNAEQRFRTAGQRGNPYSIQRRLGFGFLLFAPDLEREYHDTLFPQTRLRIRAMSGLGALGVLVFLGIDRFIGDALMTKPAAWLLSLAGIPMIMMAFLASFRARGSEPLRRAILAAFVGYGLILTTSILWSRMLHPDMPYESLIVLTFADYLLSGLSMYEAVAAGLSVLFCHTVGGWVLGVQSAALPYEVFYLTLANLIGFIGAYTLEYQSRLSFLASNELRLLSMHDGLTGLLNRRTFRRHLHRVWKQARRDGKTLGMIRLDVDHFKEINDQHSHDLGDRVLRALALSLRSLARRPFDAVGRVGGDEFEGVWYEVGNDWFTTLGDGLRKQLQRELVNAGLEPDFVTLSGSALLILPDQEGTVTEALRQIDHSLHQAKRGGRNTILYCNSADQTPPATASA